jgi:hypothetical protein
MNVALYLHRSTHALVRCTDCCSYSHLQYHDSASVSLLLCEHCNRNQQKALQEKKKGDREKAEKLKKTVIAPETNEDRVARLQQLPIKLAVDQDTTKSVPVGVLMKV